MGLKIKYYHSQDQLAYLLHRLVEIIRLENSFTFQLIQEATRGKSAVIQLDTCMLQIRGNSSGIYEIQIDKVEISHRINFKAQSKALRRIMAGAITIDKAIADQEIFICGHFKDIMNIYRLTTCLLSDSVLSHRLRNLWDEFLISWEENQELLIFSSFENQQAHFDKFIKYIPNHVLQTGVK